MVTAAMKLKMLAPWKESYDKPRQHIKKQRHYFANKGPSSQSYGFFSSRMDVRVGLYQNFPQFFVIHIVKGFGIANNADFFFFWNYLAFSFSFFLNELFI